MWIQPPIKANTELGTLACDEELSNAIASASGTQRRAPQIDFDCLLGQACKTYLEARMGSNKALERAFFDFVQAPAYFDALYHFVRQRDH